MKTCKSCAFRNFSNSFIFSVTEKNAKWTLDFHFFKYFVASPLSVLVQVLQPYFELYFVSKYFKFETIYCVLSSSQKLLFSSKTKVELSKVFLKFSIKKLVWSIQKFALQLLFLSGKLYPGLFTCPINFMLQNLSFSESLINCIIKDQLFNDDIWQYT